MPKYELKVWCGLGRGWQSQGTFSSKKIARDTADLYFGDRPINFIKVEEVKDDDSSDSGLRDI